jgi:hypothetical protein
MSAREAPEALGKRIKGPLAGGKWKKDYKDESPRVDVAPEPSPDGVSLSQHALDSTLLWGEGGKPEPGACVKVCPPNSRRSRIPLPLRTPRPCRFSTLATAGLVG